MLSVLKEFLARRRMKSGSIPDQKNVAAPFVATTDQHRDDADVAYDDPAALFDAGMQCLRQGDKDDASYFFALAIERDPRHRPALTALADLRRQQGNLGEAIELCQDGLQMAPDDAELNTKLAKYYRDLGDYAAARRFSTRALELQPMDIATKLSHAQVMLWTGSADEALTLVRTVFEENPEHILARWNLMSMLLQEQRFAEGWPHYEALMRKRLHATRFGTPTKPWSGEPLAGKRVLIFGEQGLGDEIMFASCIPEVLRDAALTVVECAPKLGRIFAWSFPQAVIHAGKPSEGREWLREFEPIDYQIPIGSLASVFRRERAAFRAEPYLRIPVEVAARWRGKLSELGPGLKVGISWRGGSIGTGTHARSIPLREWLPILSVPGVSFVNLQYTDCADELRELEQDHGIRVTTWNAALDDYAETVGLVSALDLVISVCTTIVVAASGVGVPVWVMAPPGVKWPYPRGQQRTPWAPTARVYWRGAEPQWTPVIEVVAADLRHRATTATRVSSV